MSGSDNCGKPLDPGTYRETLLGSFLEDCCLDDIRQIATDLGARPYRVFWVRTRWSGKRRGEGVETVISVEEVLPTPKIDPISAIQLQLQDIGMDEQGNLNVSEISPRYQEWQLLGRNPDGSEIPKNETFSWEIRLSRDDTNPNTRRRFVTNGVPSYEATRLQWTARIVLSGMSREDSGVPG